ncbi:10520_t:CDS:2, partial [Dentiscutata heterogama]
KSQNVPTVCNGYAEFCNIPYSQISFIATHNSYAYGNNVAANQNFDIPTQLKDGIRVFLLDGHKSPSSTSSSTSSEIELCHQSCSLLDSGTATNTLKNITKFLQQNPNEVITIFWENFDNIAPINYKTSYDQAGLTQYCFTQPVDEQWPTMAEIIQSGKRVINFIDNNADTDSVPWLMPEYSYVFETPFENFNPNAWQCTVDRPKDQPQQMYMINHFLYNKITNTNIEIPQRDSANVTNAANLAQHVQNCTNIFVQRPNYVTVDFYNKGSNNINAFSIVAGLNNVSYISLKTGGTDGTKQSGASSLELNVQQ